MSFAWNSMNLGISSGDLAGRQKNPHHIMPRLFALAGDDNHPMLAGQFRKKLNTRRCWGMGEPEGNHCQAAALLGGSGKQTSEIFA